MSCKEFTVSETKLSLPWVFVAEEEKENKMKLMRVISKDLVFEMYSTSSITCEGKCRAQEEETVMKKRFIFTILTVSTAAPLISTSMLLKK